MADQATAVAAKTLLDICREKNLTLATAESCTGGLVAGAISEIAGSSLVLDRGFVTYSNTAKQQMLGVSSVTIDVHGAVSRECAEEMAKGALAHASVDLAVSITGIAGPTGAVPGKPIGLVLFLCGLAQRPRDRARTQIRRHWPCQCSLPISFAGFGNAAGTCGKGSAAAACSRKLVAKYRETSPDLGLLLC